MAQKKENYGNDSISSLKGADRVRKRPGVIFGSDGLDGCKHAVFEIMSNAIDEARTGHGNVITVTRFSDKANESRFNFFKLKIIEALARAYFCFSL